MAFNIYNVTFEEWSIENKKKNQKMYGKKNIVLQWIDQILIVIEAFLRVKSDRRELAPTPHRGGKKKPFCVFDCEMPELLFKFTSCFDQLNCVFVFTL